MTGGRRLCYPQPMHTLREIPADASDAEEEAWDRAVASVPHAPFLQSWAWGRLRASQGWRVRRFELRAEDRAVARAQTLIKGPPGLAFAYLPRGPVCPPDAQLLSALLAHMRAALRGCVALRVEPPWWDGPDARAALSAAGLAEGEAVQPPSTLWLDLAPSEEALLGAMKSKWRYNVRLAARRGVRVRRVGEEGLPRLEALLAETATRQGIAARPSGYHAAAYRAFGPDRARLYAAEHEGRVLAMVFVLHFGRVATYLYGGSGDEGREHMPNHALQWAAIREAREDGLSAYDFWGVPDALGRAATAGASPSEVPQGEGGLWGVWGFKRGFGGEVRRSVGAWEAVHGPLRQRLVRAWLARRRGGA